eukprot:156163-Prymnesium_polylepis.1
MQHTILVFGLLHSCLPFASLLAQIAEHFPGVKIRLGLPSEVPHCPEIVTDLEASGVLSYYTWPLGDESVGAS